VRPKDFYGKVRGFLSLKLKYDHADMVGWSSRKALFRFAQAYAYGKMRKHPRAVFRDPDGVKPEGMVYKPLPKPRCRRRKAP
jgi:hypothetical protein